MNHKRIDRLLALLFFVAIAALIALMAANRSFFDWAFARHQNQFSWYIRPLFLIPFCYFAYRHSFAGIGGTLFLLLASMFFFPKPASVSAGVQAFLKMERDYLTGGWNSAKILTACLVPGSLAALAAAFWKRSLYLGIAVLVLIAVAKVLWSAAFGGASGRAVLAPAAVGLAVCVALVLLAVRRLRKKEIARSNHGTEEDL